MFVNVNLIVGDAVIGKVLRTRINCPTLAKRELPVAKIGIVLFFVSACEKSELFAIDFAS
jgi:hypothetical protein